MRGLWGNRKRVPASEQWEIMGRWGLTRHQWNHARVSMDLTVVLVYSGAMPRYREEEVVQKFGRPGGEPTKDTKNTKGNDK